MGVRRRKRLIWIGTIVLGLSAVGILIWGFIAPRDVSVPVTGPAEISQQATGSADSAWRNQKSLDERPTHAELDPILSLNLRRPLYDPVVSAPQRAATPKPAATASPIPVRLIGTIHEPGHSMAMFQKSDGSIEVCPQGQSVKDGQKEVKVITIGRRTVTVEHEGQSQDMAVPTRDKEQSG